MILAAFTCKTVPTIYPARLYELKVYAAIYECMVATRTANKTAMAVILFVSQK